METSESPVCHPFLAQSQQEQEGPSNFRDAAAIHKREAATASSQKQQQKSPAKFGQSASSNSVNLDTRVCKQEQGDGRQSSHLEKDRELRQEKEDMQARILVLEEELENA